MIIKNVMDEFSKRSLHNWYLYFVTKSLKNIEVQRSQYNFMS
jgi:hypothetical protein